MPLGWPRSWSMAVIFRTSYPCGHTHKTKGLFEKYHPNCVNSRRHKALMLPWFESLFSSCFYLHFFKNTAAVLIRLTVWQQEKKVFDPLSIRCIRASIRKKRAAERHGEILHTFRFSSSSPHFNPLPPTHTHRHTHTLTHTCSSAASHWSCKLCLRHVYAQFLPTISCHWPITAKSITSLLERLIVINCWLRHTDTHTHAYTEI